MIVLNGSPKDGYDGVGLLTLLVQEGYDIRRIAVELNGEIVPKDELEKWVVHGGDTLEVVSFVGGG